MGEGVVEAIQLNRLIGRVKKIKTSYSIIYKKIKCNRLDDECDDHADGALRREAHRLMERIGGFMKSP